MHLTRLFRNSYIARCLRLPDGSTNGIGSTWELDLDHDRWETVEAIVAKVQMASYFRWLWRGLLELYKPPHQRLTKETWEFLSAELRIRYEDPTWIGQVLDRARIQQVIWDPFWKPGVWAGPDPRLIPSLRISSSLAAFHPDARDYEGCNLITDWAEYFDLSIDSLADLEELVDKVISANLDAGAVSLKSPIAYQRSLAIRPTSRQLASQAFGTPESRISPTARHEFEDYMIRFYLDRAREHGLVFQVHTGLARLDSSNPLLLAPLLEEYHDVTFDIFHGGYPWVHEVGALAQNYPNVRLNLTWLPQLSTEASVIALKEWLQVVPQSNRISWGADCWTVEECYGALLAAKHVVARALSELVDEGYVDLEAAVEAAHSVLTVAGTQIYHR